MVMNATNVTSDLPIAAIWALGGGEAQAGLLTCIIIAFLAFGIYGLLGVGFIASGAWKKKSKYVAGLFVSFLFLAFVWAFMRYPEWALWVVCAVIGIAIYGVTHTKRAHRMKDTYLYIATGLIFIGAVYIKQVADIIVSWITHV